MRSSARKRTILADRLQNIPPYPFAAISRRVRELESQGHDIIKLDIGSPDLPPPPQVIDALCASARNPLLHGYGGFAGTPEIRRSFARYYAQRFGVELDPESEVLPLIGSKEGIVNLHLAILNPGDVALVPDPGYIAYSRAVVLAGAEPYLVPLEKQRGYMPALEAIPRKVLERAKILWINYPNNPTGAVASVDQLTSIAQFCRDHDLLLCSDNPYSDVTFGDFTAPSVLSVPGAKDFAVEFNSISKTFNMAGWRIGVCVGHAPVVEALHRIKSNIDSGMFQVVQDAACVALNDIDASWLRARNKVYERRRDLVVENLPRLGLRGSPPQGGLYVWASVDEGDDQAYVVGALEEAHVSLSPGSFYGPSGSGHVRISLVVDEEHIHEAVERLAAWHAHRDIN